MEAGRPERPRARMRPPDAEEALEAAVWSLRRWAQLAGVDARRVIGSLSDVVVVQRTCALLRLGEPADAGADGPEARDASGLTYRVLARPIDERDDAAFAFEPEPTFDRLLVAFFDPMDLAVIEVWRLERRSVIEHADRVGERLSLRWLAARADAKVQYARDVA